MTRIKDAIAAWVAGHPGKGITVAMISQAIWDKHKTRVEDGPVMRWLDVLCDRFSEGVWLPRDKSKKVTQMAMF